MVVVVVVVAEAVVLVVLLQALKVLLLLRLRLRLLNPKLVVLLRLARGGVAAALRHAVVRAARARRRQRRI